MRMMPYIKAESLHIASPTGRVLFRDLDMAIDGPIAITGRNGVGKSTLLSVLSGERAPDAGSLSVKGTVHLVPQLLQRQQSSLKLNWDDHVEFAQAGLSTVIESGASLGEQRKLHLIAAKQSHADLLLLDEPTQDLDAQGVHWLCGWLRSWRQGLVVVTHDLRLLRCFHDFLVVEEAGVHYFAGQFELLKERLAKRQDKAQGSFARRLKHHAKQEEKMLQLKRRKQRKRNLGRIHEEARNPSRSQLGDKKRYAQESQGKAKRLREARLRNLRSQTKSLRSALTVTMPLRAVLRGSTPSPNASVSLRDVSLIRDERLLFSNISLEIRKQRIAVTGRNGTGKSSFLELVADRLLPSAGSIQRNAVIAYIAQAGENWMLEHSLIAELIDSSNLHTLTDLTNVLLSHRFPLALAERSLRSLSPGERIRAALIVVSHQRKSPDLLLLDEPTNNLDLLGTDALLKSLQAFEGALVVASHRSDVIEALNIDTEIDLG